MLNKCNPKVSVIVPVHNNEKYLSPCLDSIVNQTLKDIEIICINDGSTDSSIEIMNKYADEDSRFIILNETNCGAGLARKKGIDASNGDYIFLLDSDDILEKNALELTYKKSINNDSDMVFFKVRYFDTNINYEYIPEKFDLTSFFSSNKEFNCFNWKKIKPVVLNRFTSIWCCLYSSSFLKNNDFYFPKELSFNDVPLHVQSLILANKISFIPEILYNYRLYNENSITTKSHNSKKVFDIFEITDFIEKFLFSQGILDNFRLELINFKIETYTYHLNRIQGDKFLQDFFNEMKLRFLEFELDKIEYENLNKNNKIEFTSVIDSSTYSEYKIRKKKYESKIREFNLKTNNIKISVIIPVYNVQDYLSECLDSIINQTLKDIEIICVNDGSTDSSLEILEKYAKKDSRITIINQKNCGLGCARNSGLLQASGEYISFIDSDDYISLDSYESLYNNAISNNSDIVFFKIARFNDFETIFSNPAFPFDDYFKGVEFNNFIFNYDNIKNYVLNGSFSACAKIYKKSFLDLFDDFKFPVGVAYEDVLFHVKCLLRASKLSFEPKFLYYYRISNQNSIMHTESNAKDIFKICNFVEEFLKKNDFYDKFYEEFINFKIIQLSQYIIHANSEDYFNKVKSELKSLKLNDKNISSDIIWRYNNVIKFETFEEYQSQFNKNSAKISVIIPVYNSEKYISCCLDSLINQSFKDIEIICVNDGSTDNSLKILNEYSKKDNRIKIFNKPNGGAGSARNVGLNQASGKYVSFIDSDDWLDSNTYNILYKKCESEDLDVLLFQLINYDDISHELYEDEYYNVTQIPSELDNKVFNHLDIKNSLFSIAVSPCNKLYKHEILKGMSFSEGVMFEDNPFFFEAILKTKRISIIREHFYFRRRRSGSVMNNDGEKLVDAIFIANKVLDVIKESKFFDIYKINAINFKYTMIRTWFNRINSNYKELYFNEMKKDFNFVYSNNEKYDEFKRYAYVDLKEFFQNVLKFNSFNEWKLYDENILLKQKLNNLENNLNDLTNQVSELSKLNSYFIKLNSDAYCKLDLLKHQNNILKTKLIQNKKDNSKGLIRFKKFFKL